MAWASAGDSCLRVCIGLAGSGSDIINFEPYYSKASKLPLPMADIPIRTEAYPK
jgi:hypothetical protein